MSRGNSVNRYGKPPARYAVLEGMKHGLTSKETAYAYGYSLRSIQMAASRMKVAFKPVGMGRPPSHPVYTP